MLSGFNLAEFREFQNLNAPKTVSSACYVLRVA